MSGGSTYLREPSSPFFPRRASDMGLIPRFLCPHYAKQSPDYREKDWIEEATLRRMEAAVKELESHDEQEIKLRFMRMLRDSLNDDVA